MVPVTPALIGEGAPDSQRATARYRSIRTLVMAFTKWNWKKSGPAPTADHPLYIQSHQVLQSVGSKDVIAEVAHSWHPAYPSYPY